MSSRSNSVVYINAKGKRAVRGRRRRGVGVLDLECCDAGRIQTIEWAAHRAGHSVAKPASPFWDDTCIIAHHGALRCILSDHLALLSLLEISHV